MSKLKQQPIIVSPRQPDGVYRVHVSDGAEHHFVGTVRQVETRGPRNGERRRWSLTPAEGLEVKPEGPTTTLGEGRRRLAEAWVRAQQVHRSNERRGKLVVVEGPDGAGKTTLIRELLIHLRARGTEVLPELEAGRLVLCSRYVLSSLAYQGPEVGFEWVAELNRHAPPPDLLLFLDVPAELGLQRVESSRRKADAMETPKRAQAAAAGYRRALAHVEREGVLVVRLDATVPADQLFVEALAHIQRVLVQPGSQQEES